MICELKLTSKEQKCVRDVASGIFQELQMREEASFLERAAIYAQELPRRIREILHEFKISEPCPVMLIQNSPIADADIGPSPSIHWVPGEYRPLNIAQIIQGLYACLLGEPFGFQSQQRGRIFNDLITTPGSPDNASSGAGAIGLHTEDAFQFFMPDYLSLMCLRNDQKAMTILSSLGNDPLPQGVLEALFERDLPCFAFTPTNQMLFGNRTSPYLRYGLVDRKQLDPAKRAAIREITDLLLRNQVQVTLAQGECLFVDNYRAVHGRMPFPANYGHKSRWFSRLVLLRDLRKTRSSRSASGDRVIRNVNGINCDPVSTTASR